MTDDEERDRERERQTEQVDAAIGAVDQMMGIVDGFEAYVFRAARRDQHGTQYRLNLLWIHAVAALLIAPALSLTGRDGLRGPSFTFLRTLPGAPYSLSTVVGLGGLILGLGCVFRAKRVEVAGLVLLTLFYACMSISLGVPPVKWLFDGGMKPPMYGPVVYLHLTVIMAVHQWALIMRRRDDESAGRATARRAAGGEL